MVGRSLGRCSSNSSVVVVVAKAAAGNDSTNDKMLMCKHEYERLSCLFGKAQDFSVYPRFLSAPPPLPPPLPLSSSATDDVL
ncbi:hypothetical protein HZH68_009794 [Vespula germanica]|uniref:Uncharacterized protein n=1 Tax=Vespula germanica TaxID=30212 RepID=A0A834JZA3_VESGE|nr:hypothetical protein HZH68_009794 [Vespula germanica]